jgi:signal transduction histidine kinase
MREQNNNIAHVLAAIRKQFGYIPPFLTFIQSTPSLLANHWQQTQALYISTPIPNLFKEKLFLYLSYLCHAPYDIRCHCLSLYSLGQQEADIIALLQRPYPSEAILEEHLERLKSISDTFTTWPETNTVVELTILLCTAHIFVEGKQTKTCQQELQRIMGTFYFYILGLISYIQACHYWAKMTTDMPDQSDPIIEKMFERTFGNQSRLALHLQRSGSPQKEEQEPTKTPSTSLNTNIQQLVQQETTKRMNDWLGIIAHELRTPVTTIKGSVQILLRYVQREITQLPANPKDYAHMNEVLQRLLIRADNQATRLTRLINDIVYVSRVQTRKQAPLFQPYDLKNVLIETVKQQRKLTPNRIIELSLPEAPVPVQIDVEEIQKVMRNYLSNALKYSELTRPIEVILKRDTTKAQVLVHDYGSGLSPTEQEHIWERFYRVQGNEVKSGSEVGLGLGLYIAHSIIAEHGGEVGQDSQPDRGSTFWFTLPIAQTS